MRPGGKMATDTVLEFMEQHKLERTRETYLEILFMGEVPDVIDGETEAELPEEFRRAKAGDWEEFG
jgi:hypothetical protein